MLAVADVTAADAANARNDSTCAADHRHCASAGDVRTRRTLAQLVQRHDGGLMVSHGCSGCMRGAAQNCSELWKHFMDTLRDAGAAPGAADDVVRYRLYDAHDGTREHLVRVREQCMQIVDALVGEYIWQRDPFQLFLSHSEAEHGGTTPILCAVLGRCFFAILLARPVRVVHHF